MKATFPEDQKYLDTIIIKALNIFEWDEDQYSEYDSQDEFDARFDFDQKIKFEIGFGKNEITEAINNMFEGYIPMLIADYASTRMKIEVDDCTTVYDDGYERIEVISQDVIGWPYPYDGKELVENEIKMWKVLETFPLMGMVIDLKTLLIDAGCETFFDDYNEGYMSDVLMSITWKWAERYLNLKRESWDLQDQWPVETVKFALDAINGKQNAIFHPCDEFKDAKSYIRNFVVEEDRLWQDDMIKNKDISYREFYKFVDQETGLIKRDKLDMFLRNKSSHK